MDIKFTNKYSCKFLLFCAIWAFFWLCFSYCFLQKFLFMNPEMFSARIRFDLIVLGFGILMVAFSKSALSALCGYVMWLYGTLCGLAASIGLKNVHETLRSDSEMSGLMGCGGTNEFLNFNLGSLEIFRPFSTCAFDVPVVPDGFVASGIRENLINAYSSGWYLFPASKGVNLPTLWMIVFGFFLFVFVFGVFLGFINSKRGA